MKRFLQFFIFGIVFFIVGVMLGAIGYAIFEILPDKKTVHYQTTANLKGADGLLIPAGSELIRVYDKGSGGGYYVMSFSFSINDEVVKQKAKLIPSKSSFLAEYPITE